jgi:hypothetical protein
MAQPAVQPLTGVLAELAGLGPFFTLDSHPPRSAPVPPWRPLEELLSALPNALAPPDALAARATVVREALAEASGQTADAVELRVAASLAQLGLAARLICPALGVAALTGGVLAMDPAGLRWHPAAGGTIALSIRDDALRPAPAGQRSPAALADLLAASLVTGPVRALVEASRAFGVSEQVLWGNVASVVHGAVALLGAARPELADRARAVTTGLLNRPPLQGRHQSGADGRFRRRSCCLMYRLTGSATATAAPVCGDCVLDRASTSQG